MQCVRQIHCFCGTKNHTIRWQLYCSTQNCTHVFGSRTQEVYIIIVKGLLRLLGNVTMWQFVSTPQAEAKSRIYNSKCPNFGEFKKIIAANSYGKTILKLGVTVFW